MEKTESGLQDLSALISNAESDIDKKAAARGRPVKQRRYPSMPTVILGVILVCLAYFGHWLWVALRPPPQTLVAHDLGLAIDQARDSIEEAKASTGELPEALPNASLAAVVRYEPDRDDYKLVATMMGVRVTLQKNGSRSTDMGVNE